MLDYRAPSLIRERVYRRLRSDILACRLTPGADLHEMDLARDFAVSKSPVRDALLRLETEGLVEVLPRKGYRIAPLTIEVARELFELREALEPACMIGAADAADDDALAALDVWREFDLTRGFPAWVDYNRNFHVALVALSPNSRMVTTAVGVIEQCERLSHLAIAAYENTRAGGPLAEHSEIIDALQARDGQRAAALLARHHGDGRVRVMKAIRDRLDTRPV
ncbi:MAG: GntR family transcriptional regulator [Alphaproteobacteria bacterium]